MSGHAWIFYLVFVNLIDQVGTVSIPILQVRKLRWCSLGHLPF